jgi:hypothetical protein
MSKYKGRNEQALEMEGRRMESREVGVAHRTFALHKDHGQGTIPINIFTHSDSASLRQDIVPAP